MFEKASRLKLTFNTARGLFSVDDLWDLPLTSAGGPNLDYIARMLHKQLKSGDDVSFVEPARKSDETVQLRFDLVKHVIDVKLAENAAVRLEKERSEKKQKIMGIIAAKQDESLQQMSMDYLQKLMADL